MTPHNRRALERLALIRQANRARRLSQWAATVERVQATPARTPVERLAKQECLEALEWARPVEAD